MTDLLFPPGVFASSEQCVAASSIVANEGPTSGSWSDPGVARDVVFDCSDGPCQFTGEITTWPCADPLFTYAGPDTGYEYAYSFTAPSDGTCTFIEYEEGFSGPGGGLLGVVDWFIVAAANNSVCGPESCIAYIWENVNAPICGSDPRATCSSFSFDVVEGQEFFIVADIFAGPDAKNPEVYPFNESWNVEINCELADSDGDGIEDNTDNCPGIYNPGQEDFDDDGTGYVCDFTCAPGMDFVHIFDGDGVFDLQASGLISYGGTITSGADISFDAAQGIELKNDTNISPGGVMTIMTTGCFP